MEHGRVWGVKKEKVARWRVFIKGTMSLGIAEQVRKGLTLVYAHMLPEIVVTAEILPASLDGTLVRCKRKSQ